VTVAEIQAAVREAVRAGETVTGRGFGTYSSGVPAGARIVDTRGLDGIVEYDPADLTVTVEAGIRCDALDAALAEHGQWLPVDVLSPDRTTVGGMIAAGLTGPLRRSFGSLRDQLIGIEWVGGEGQLLRSGGRVVKNVAGYDLMKLHVGARGRLGVVTKATFKVWPCPADRPPPGVAEPAPPRPGGRAQLLWEHVIAALDPAHVFGPVAPGPRSG
jgi:glycolate oxidase FAD binding subunit